MFEIRVVDTTDESLLRSVWDLGAASAHEGVATHDFPSWPSAREQWSQRSDVAEWRLWGAYAEGRLVGYAEISLTLLDNPHLGAVFVCVDGASRRQGCGSALLCEAIEDLRGSGRSVMWAGMTAGLEEVPAGQRFAEAHDFVLAQFDVEKAVDIASQRSGWAPMLDDVVADSPRYEVVAWVGRTPEEHVGAVCHLMANFNGEIPLGDLDLENEHWDRARLRQRELRFEATGKHSCMALAVARDGSAAGYTEVVVDEGWPGIGFQEGTLVLPAHRGHRLGLRLKLANHLQIVEGFPQVRTIETGNAGDNAHMSAVNELLGFRPVARWLELQRRW